MAASLTAPRTVPLRPWIGTPAADAWRQCPRSRKTAGQRRRAAAAVAPAAHMSYWLLKTEPGEWSWDCQSESGGISKWDGVRSPQAQRHMRDMCIGDLCFFYHTGKEKAIIGIVAVTVAAYPDPSDPDGKCDMVDVCEVCKLNETVTLKALKDDEVIDDFLLLRQPRLSVVPVSQHNWERACRLGGLTVALVAPWKPPKRRAQRYKKVT